MNKKIAENIIKDIGQQRFNHSLRVRDIAVKLASLYGVETEKAEKAAFYHDCGKIKDDTLLLQKAREFNIQLDDYMKESHELIHAPLGSKMSEEIYGIKDRDILNAIKYHTTGKEDMNMLEKIIYMADYVEPMRTFAGVEDIREMAFKDIDKALFMALDSTIIFLIEKRKLIQPKTIIARNKLIII